MKIKEWFAYTIKDFTDFFLRQSNVIITFTLLLFSSFFFGHYFTLCSDPYKISEQFVRDSTLLSDQFGPVRFVNLQPFASVIKWQGNSGYAELELNTGGNTNYGKVRTYLTRMDGEWHLEKAHAITKDHDVVILKQ